MRNLCVAFVVTAVSLSPAWGQTEEQRKTTVAYLQDCQQPDGGFVPSKTAPRSSLRASSAALRALKYFGGEPRDRAACARFVPRCF